MPWGVAAAVVGAYISSEGQKSAANKAAKGQQNAANQAIQASQQNYDRTAANLDPYINAGKSALGQMQALNSGDFSSFTNSPDYAYTRDQMQQGIERGAAAHGSLYSGGTSIDLAKALNGIASQNYGQFYSRIAGLAENGQNAAGNLGSVGTGNAGVIGNAATNAANANANAAYNTANANSNMYGSMASAFGNAYGQMNSAPTSSSYSSLGGSGTAPYQVGMNDGSFNSSGGFNLATAGRGG